MISTYQDCHCHFQVRSKPEVTMNTALLSAASPNQQLDFNDHAQEREWFYLGWTRSPAA